MSIKSDYAGQYSSKQDELLIYEGGGTSSVILTLSGKIDVYMSPIEELSGEDTTIINKSCRLFTLNQNTFLGINDILGNGKNSFSLKAKENGILYCFPSNSLKDINNIMSAQKDYSAYIVSSLATVIDHIYNAYQKLLPICQSISALTQNLCIYYWAIKDKYFFRDAKETDILLNHQTIYEDVKNSNYKFLPYNTDCSLSQYIIENSANTNEMDTSSIEYFCSLLNVPLEQRKGFFNSDGTVCEYHVQKGSEVLNLLNDEIKALLSQLCENMGFLYTTSNNLIFRYGKIAADSKEDTEAAISVLNILKQAIDLLSNNIEKLQNEFSCFAQINRGELHEYYDIIESKINLPKSSVNSDGIISVSTELPQELNNSLENILKYCSYSQDQIDSFNKKICMFRAAKDKFSSDPEIRELRSSISNEFFVIYEQAYKKVKEHNSCPKLISMFLNFGYMDERLLTKEQTMALYRLCDKEYSDLKYSVYSAKSWLDQIYTHKKSPSINDFGLDYTDTFRELKKKKAVTDNDKASYDNDYNAKLNFEINNMIKTNQKVCHGQMSSYFPILHKDIIARDLEKSVITPTKIQQAIDKLLAIDFSIFYREVRYKNELKGIEKETIMKEVFPDIVIVPTFGSRGSMWQEITGRDRNTPGRFILPAFTDESIDTIFLNLIGAFRWELCRTMMGVSWNDITEKSLTSEYTDYIQFYKKNHDLSDDAKNKIKIQIQKNRNMLKDIFTSDYETWIEYESKGILRLNKIARSILFRYCPLPKQVRETLSKQPAFSELAMQLNASRAKTAKSLAGAYTKLFKNEPIDNDMELNLIFYRDL